MFRRSRFSALFAGVFAIGAVMAMTGPVAAETIEKSCRTSATNSAAGACGTWQVHDQDTGGKQDATCVYSASSHALSKLTLKAPKMFGHYSTKTKVAWRAHVLRSSSTHQEQPHNVYTSAWQTGKASSSSAATGFSLRSYSLPSAGPGDNDYYITVDFKWWNASNTAEGFVNISYDFYKGVRGSTSHVFLSHCGADF